MRVTNIILILSDTYLSVVFYWYMQTRLLDAEHYYLAMVKCEINFSTNNFNIHFSKLAFYF